MEPEKKGWLPCRWQQTGVVYVVLVLGARGVQVVRLGWLPPDKIVYV